MERRASNARHYLLSAKPDADPMLRWLVEIVQPGVTPQRSRELKRLVDRQLGQGSRAAQRGRGGR